MVKPSGLSIGIGFCVLALTGSGVAIPSLWSRAYRAESNRDQLQNSLQESRTAKGESETALAAAKLQLTELQKQTETAAETLAAAQETKRVLTNQVASLQARNRDLTGASGTLELRDEELDVLVQQLEQARSDIASLVAQRDAPVTTNKAEAGDRVVASNDTAKSDADTAKSDADAGESEHDVIEADDLVPVPPRGTTVPPRGTTVAQTAQPRQDQAASATSQRAAKPPATGPVRFDDRGWKSVAPGAAAPILYRTPTVIDSSNVIIVP